MMKKIFFLASLILLILAACTNQGDPSSLAATKGGMSLSLDVSPNPPLSMESSTLQIKLSDANQSPIQGAKITVDLSMPAMQMPMNNPKVTEVGQGIYTVDAMFTMAGEWQILIDVSADSTEVFSFPIMVK